MRDLPPKYMYSTCNFVTPLHAHCYIRTCTVYFFALTQDNFNGIRIFIIISYESIAVPVLCEVSYLDYGKSIYNVQEKNLYIHVDWCVKLCS